MKTPGLHETFEAFQVQMSRNTTGIARCTVCTVELGSSITLGSNNINISTTTCRKQNLMQYR